MPADLSGFTVRKHEGTATISEESVSHTADAIPTAGGCTEIS